MSLQVYTDGGSLNNPGLAASAYVIYQNEKIIAKEGKKIGTATNNFAEYMALILAWEKILALIKDGKIAKPKKISFFADSQLLVNQLLGLYKIKNQALKILIQKIRELEKKANTAITYTHILREKNSLADSLVKAAFYS